MIFILVLCLLCGSSWAQYRPQRYSYSAAVGAGTGSSFASAGEGRITSIRVWERPGSYITGFQLKYDYSWSPVYGVNNSDVVEMSLFENEAFVQISGKYNPSNFIYQLVFVTSRGRSLIVGHPVSTSFNLYPKYPESELRIISGRASSSGITSIGAHWGVIYNMPPPNMIGNDSMSSHE
ncbi:zymogen granule membrane protein 16-like [Conger conger]|nr:zymogen granule membrane protein 16-like [Conger conger]